MIPSIVWRQPTLVFLPGESHGQRSLVGYSSWDHKSWTQLSATHVHRGGDTIQPSHPLSSHSPPAFNLSQHQGLF